MILLTIIEMVRRKRESSKAQSLLDSARAREQEYRANEQAKLDRWNEDRKV